MSTYNEADAAIAADFAVWLASEGARVEPLDERLRLLLRLAFVGGRVSGIKTMADSMLSECTARVVTGGEK